MNASTQASRTLAVVSSGVSSPSSSRLLANRLAGATAARLAESGVRAELTSVDLRDRAIDITRSVIQGFGSPALEDMIERVTSADGAIFVTPIFAATSDWGSAGATTASSLPARIDRAAAQLAALVLASNRSQRRVDPVALSLPSGAGVRI